MDLAHARKDLGPPCVPVLEQRLLVIGFRGSSQRRTMERAVSFSAENVLLKFDNRTASFRFGSREPRYCEGKRILLVEDGMLCATCR